MEEIRLEPVPSILIESLRDIGYSFNTAVADIVDNSISANASMIDILIPPAESPAMTIVDNGTGLTRSELLEAMRLGSTDPRKERARNDLGRFGLGMKTASFSQCRRLTVISKTAGKAHGFAWDLDEVVKQNSWLVDEVMDFDDIQGIDLLQDSGTLVLWEKLDRLSGNLGGGKPNIDRIIDEAADHLSLVFHRYLAGEAGTKRIGIRINNRLLEALDPFNSRNSATQVTPEEVPLLGVRMRAYTLPNRDCYTSQKEYERYGLGDYLKNQGVYLYRAKRLILYGTWLGLAKKSAVTQLCRVRIDIDNGQDELWKIDVKKASAQLPEVVRNRVKDLVGRMCRPSRRVYKRRGAKQVDQSLKPVWSVYRADEGSTYSVNRDHPSIKAYRESLATAEDRRSFDSIIGLIESGFPTKALFYDMTTDADHVAFAAISEDELTENARNFYGMMKGTGVSDQTIINTMRQSEPFASNWAKTCHALGIEEE